MYMLGEKNSKLVHFHLPLLSGRSTIDAGYSEQPKEKMLDKNDNFLILYVPVIIDYDCHNNLSIPIFSEGAPQ